SSGRPPSRSISGSSSGPSRGRSVKAVIGFAIAIAIVLGLLLAPAPVVTPPSWSQGVDVFLNVTQRGSKKFGIAHPEFVRGTPGPDEGNFNRAMPEIIGNARRCTSLFTVVANEPPLPNGGDALKKRFGDLAAAGAHGAMQGWVGVTGQRVTVE